MIVHLLQGHFISIREEMRMYLNFHQGPELLHQLYVA